MCLYLGKRQSDLVSYKEIKSRAKNGKVTCWKVYRKSQRRSFVKGSLSSLVYVKVIKGPGIVWSNRFEKKLSYFEKSSCSVDYGIHVYTNIEVAKSIKEEDSDVVVPVECDLNDLVAYGIQNEAVFMKVKITRKEWNRAFKDGK